jgi:hypothetical protein
LVEKLLLGTSNVVFRLGLVFGDKSGGVFGDIRKQVQNSRILPIIGNGMAPQYLLHERTLAKTILRAVSGTFDRAGGVPISLAFPEPWRFRDLVRSIAASESRQVVLIPVPWQLLYVGLRAGEAIGLKLPFRSDSVISFIHCNRSPEFSMLNLFGIDPLPYGFK